MKRLLANLSSAATLLTVMSILSVTTFTGCKPKPSTSTPAPKLTLTASPACTNQAQFSLTCTATTATSAVTPAVKLNGVALTTGVQSSASTKNSDGTFSTTITITSTLTQNQDNSFEVTIKDAHNKTASATAKITYLPAGPVIALGQMDNQYLKAPAFNLPVTVTSAGTVSTTVSQNGTQIAQSTAASFTASATLADLQNSFEVRSTDCAGNESVAKLAKINLLTMTPEFGLNIRSEEPVFMNPYYLPIQAHAQSDVTIKVTLNGNPAGDFTAHPGQTMTSILPLNKGANTLHVVVTDLAGNQATRDLTFTYYQVTQLAAGSAHTCALINGKVACWGRNNEGQLGVPWFENQQSANPVWVPEMTDVTAISAGGSHTCAIKTGKLYCWGLNDFGQIGNGADQVYQLPAEVTLEGPALSVSAGYRHTCAIDLQGAKCWGSNHSGQLGSDTPSHAFTPTPVLELDHAESIVAGESHTCALKGGALFCWGNNQYGQLGTGSTMTAYHPMPLGGPYVFDEIVLGSFHTCGRQGTQVLCWGANFNGQIGIGTVGYAVFTPTPLLFDMGITSLASKGSHVCASRSGISSLCWGRNQKGQLGNGSVEDSPSPVTLAEQFRAEIIATGWNHSCGLAQDGVYCWGSNSSGQLGLAPETISQRNVPTRLRMAP